LNWAIINDEKEFGITVHFIDEGIDTGDIVFQKSFPITDSDTYQSLLHVSHYECAQILYEAIKKIQSGSFKRQKQIEIHPVGFYCGRRGPGDEIIDWNRSSRELFNFIRAVCVPGPMATTNKGNEIIKINKSRIIESAPSYINMPGQLLAKTESGFLIKTNDSFIEIYDIHSSIKLKVGDKLGV
jgi:methionyl-tRNA formyltransferase